MDERARETSPGKGTEAGDDREEKDGKRRRSVTYPPILGQHLSADPKLAPQTGDHRVNASSNSCIHILLSAMQSTRKVHLFVGTLNKSISAMSLQWSLMTVKDSTANYGCFPCIFPWVCDSAWNEGPQLYE